MPHADSNDEEHIKHLVGVLYEESGLDFSKYALATLKRQLDRLVHMHRLSSIQELTNKVSSDGDFLLKIVNSLSIPTTTMFRTPPFYLLLRTKVLPALAAREVVRIWSAGCSTGEEAYSLAVLVDEAGLSSRTRIYATDVVEPYLERARKAVYPLRLMKEFTSNYLEAGGVHDFSDYYSSGYDNAVLRGSLKDCITFGHHNLISDSSFNEFDLILCRNVMIYFKQTTQQIVHKLLYDSLSMEGYLALGDKESMSLADLRSSYRVVSAQQKIYQKIV